MSENLKQKTVTGMIWSSVQKFGTLLISFSTNLVLARILIPEDFGVIGMLMVFLSLADTLVNGGFASALIQKKEPTHTDYSTVFYWNLVASVFFYLILFFSAPAIASFYKMPILSSVLRIQGLILFVDAINIVQSNKLIKTLNFKKLTKVSIISSTVGSVIGIVLALMGFGVWSLVVKMLVDSLMKSIVLWYGDSWRPEKTFSWKSFKELFNYGSLLLVSNLSETIIYHLQSIIIGRVYSAKALGYYTQAKTLTQIPERAIPQIVDQVMFPVYSSMQDNREMVLAALKKSMSSLAYLTFPIMALLTLIAEPLITLLYSDKWINSVPYFQAFSFGAMLYALNSNNVNVIKSLGRSDYILRLTLLKRFTTLIFIFIGMKFGILGIAISYSLSMYVWYPMNVYYSSKLTGYGFWAQIKDIGLNYLFTIAVAASTFFLTRSLAFHYLLNMLIVIIIFLLLYAVGSWILKIDGYKTYLNLINSKLKRKK